MVQAAKRYALANPRDKPIAVYTTANGTAVEIELMPSRRKQMMETMMLVDQASNHERPEFDNSLFNFDYNDEEDLLEIPIPDKPRDMTADPEGRRLIIKDIFVDNFKSYEGRHQLGPLHKNLTMILGPNGSGKSNVIDALLFVFGFRAKKIRTAKLTSLIHSDNGAEAALVEIVFQVIKDVDKEKYIVDTRESFTISRSIHKDNTSVYYYNNTVTTQKFIHQLLVNAGIDMTHNRFLILQGEVEAISQMKPVATKPDEEGMLEYIEDIVGTNRYVEAIAKLTHRVKDLEYKSSQYVAVSRRHEKLLRHFEPVMEDGVKYINAMNNINLTNGTIYKHELANAKETRVLNLSLKEGITEPLQEAEEEHKANKLALKEAEISEKIHRGKSDKAKAKVQGVVDQISDWRSRNHKVKEQIKATNLAISNTDLEINRLSGELKYAQDSPDRLRTNIENMLGEMQQLRESKGKLDKIYTANLQKFDAKSKIEKDKVAMLNERSENKAKDIFNIESQIQEFEAELKDLKVSDNGDDKRVMEMRKKLDNILHLNALDRERLKQHEAGAETWSAKRTEQAAKLPGLQGTIKLLRNQKYGMDRKVDEMEEKNEIYHNRHRNTTFLHQCKNDGKLSGFYGRLGDLASTTKKFDAAISTIFGGALDYHIVQTKKDVEDAIGLLIQAKLPRLSFHFVDFDRNVKEYRMNMSAESFPALRLFDQIRFEDEKIREIYYHIIGDTLICDTLEEATRLDKRYRGKYAFCNYNGDCLERTGSITGGGRPLRNRIRTDNLSLNIQHDKKMDTAKISAQVEAIQLELDNTEARLKEAQEGIIECDPQIKHHNDQAAKLRHQIQINDVAVQSLTKSIADLEAASELRPHQTECSLAELEAKKARLVRMKESLIDEQKMAEDIMKERDAGEVKARKMFDELVGKHKEQLRLTTERITQMEEDIAKERALLESNPQHVEAVKQQLRDLEQRYRELTALTERLSKIDAIDLVKEEAVHLAKLKENEAELKVADAEWALVSNQRVEVDKALLESAQTIAVLKASQEEVDRIIDEAEMNIEKFQTLLEEVENSWYTPETLDPTTKYVRATEPNFQEKINDGYLILSEEVDNAMIDCKKLLDEVEEVPKSHGYIQKLRNSLYDMQSTAESLRTKYDEKGITHFATLICLQLNELTAANRYSEMLKEHRIKLYELRSARYEEFNQALSFLGTTTQMLYQLITNGGDASLKFVEEGRSLDPFSGGIKFSVRPATKSWKLIENLSGGEKTLASLCFVFAMHHFRATPLYVMDEIDAALDLNNVRLIANYIKNSERTRNAQFIIISLRNQMFEVGNRLIGIYKTDGSTKHVIINPEKIDEINKGARKTLDAELKVLMKKKRKLENIPEEEEEDEEEQLAHSMQRVTLVAKRRRQRKLGKLTLSDFGIEVTPPKPATVTEVINKPHPTTTVLADSESDWSDEEAPKKKPKKKVAKEFDEDDDDEVPVAPKVPSPPQMPKKKRNRRN